MKSSSPTDSLNQVLAPPSSAIDSIIWPALPNAQAAIMYAVLQQLEQSQWWPPEKIRAHQFRQLSNVLSHCYNTVPFYRTHFDKAGINLQEQEIEAVWGQLPVMTRGEVQSAGDALVSTQIPASHGNTGVVETSGSTGMPIRVMNTEITRFFWDCFTVRDNLWQQRDVALKLSSIRHLKKGIADYPEGVHARGWGRATETMYRTGPASGLTIKTDISKQVEWLVREAPEYLLTYPSNLMALAHYFSSHDLTLPSLKAVQTMGEALSEECRELVREAWGVRVSDYYSSQEAGHIALQCPEHEHYHVQAENVLVEILDDHNRPCNPGETGRVMVTTLHNFATPLLRYEIGDYAEAGGQCPCGRGLPVIKRIAGRVRNMLVLPNGERRWPAFGPKKFTSVAPINQLQLVQKSLEHIEVRLVTPRVLTAVEETALTEIILSRLGYKFRLTFVYCDGIPRSRSGKFEEFRSEIAET